MIIPLVPGSPLATQIEVSPPGVGVVVGVGAGFFALAWKMVESFGVVGVVVLLQEIIMNKGKRAKHAYKTLYHIHFPPNSKSIKRCPKFKHSLRKASNVSRTKRVKFFCIYFDCFIIKNGF
ncbi:MAG TPA: hypothetical protein VJ873_07275 [bacterium]|nr:hypothetical protein [bacterium]